MEKLFFGLPVIDKYMVEQIADMVIINTSETYWDIIYHRICDIKLPVFYKNGEKATKKEMGEHGESVCEAFFRKVVFIDKRSRCRIFFDFLIHCL